MLSSEKEQFFKDMSAQHLALTYDDVRLETRHGRDTEPPDNIDVSSRFSRNTPLTMPFVSAAMDTVTTSDMAIAMAEFGGLGVMHAGLDADTQRDEVRRVKLHMNGRIDKPITVKASDTLQDVLAFCDREGFDFRTFPVEDDGKFVGVLSSKDFKLTPNKDTPVEEAMTPASEVMSKTGKVSVEEAYKLMTAHKKMMLPILDKQGRVKRLYLHSDVDRIVNDSDSFNLDEGGRLRVAAAIPTDEEGVERVRKMRKYLDVVVLDSANGDSYYAFQTLEAIKTEFPDLDVVVGNVSTGRSAYELADAGADGIKVGQGPGSICTTRTETGIGKPQVTAVYECMKAVEKFNIPVCADGGIANHGDISIALAVGAGSVMMGSMLAGTKEAPGKVIELKDGTRVKLYRGMGSAGALEESAASRKRYGAQLSGPRLAEGVESYVPYKGEVSEVLAMCWLALRNSLRYVKAYDLATHRNETQLFRISSAGLRESHPHDVMVIGR